MRSICYTGILIVYQKYQHLRSTYCKWSNTSMCSGLWNDESGCEPEQEIECDLF